MAGWWVSAVIAIVVTGLLAAGGLVDAFVPVAVALTTTALGTLLPILRDNDMLGGPLARFLMPAGAAGGLPPAPAGGPWAPALFLYRHDLVPRERAQMVPLTATSVPLLVALAAVGLDSGEMLPENAASLVGAGVLSVMVFPGVAVALNRTAPASALAEDDGPHEREQD